MAEPIFKAGDKVAWSHEFATQHAPGSIVRESAAAGWPLALIGEVVEVANPQGTWFVVKFGDERKDHARFAAASGTHPDKDCLTLTADELVRVAKEN